MSSSFSQAVNVNANAVAIDPVQMYRKTDCDSGKLENPLTICFMLASSLFFDPIRGVLALKLAQCRLSSILNGLKHT